MSRPVLRLKVPLSTRIAILPEPFGCGFDVRVLPPGGVGHDREFQSYAEARAYADTLSAAMGWPVRDQCEAEHGAG